MRTSMALALAAPLLVAADGPGRGGYGPHEMEGRDGRGPMGRGGGPGGRFGCADDGDCVYTGCASSCFSSFWETATPSPTAFCNADSGIHTCIESACTGSDDASRYSSYSSRRSSLCSEYESCSSTGVYTYTYSTPPPGEGPWGGRFSDRPFPTGEVTYTGCPWDGDGWGFPFWGGGYGGPGPWDDDDGMTGGGGRPGWTYATVTTTIASADETATATIEQAISGDSTTFRTLGIAASEETTTASGNAAPTGGNTGVKLAGAALGAVVAVAGML